MLNTGVHTLCIGSSTIGYVLGKMDPLDVRRATNVRRSNHMVGVPVAEAGALDEEGSLRTSLAPSARPSLY